MLLSRLNIQILLNTMAFASRSAPTEAFANQMDEKSMPEDRGSGGTRGNQGHKRNLSKEISKERRASGGRTRRSDMGRAEWRYLSRRSPIFCPN